MKSNALIIFIRNPQLGKVKTRLAKIIGDVNALEVYKDLLLHTMNETQSLECDKFVFYDQYIVTDDIWSENLYEKRVQFGEDLGAKMQNAFQNVFDLGYQNCIIIGSDLFDLKSDIIDNAFKKLQNNEVVIGPAEDGGYYLLGLKNIIPSLFKNKKWGTSTVLSSTIKNLKDYKIEVIETLNDIDTFEDLKKSNYKFKTILE
ncbi:TIGR04282 family arsenosugar biosynthesis glycosyltransferase [Flavobacterium soyangense]|uniref:TIGR04282 family arsenosugar biosynthesis glycosyltransferase n=1 Tax=Flavobacterium soyangense TaxID=2023265 RepID=A0A930UCE4_9FLAO|nr:TIGR04282 family arsenosugar biosynthesis glycosyltransferase [Flavobacterium soyangense]MBF2709612.1 TIGR04282 family arsenosugar biosynthesis glycosyltransferase [Flavobacterium soyangense]